MSIQYKKLDPTEEIQAGDIIMLSPNKTQAVTKAIRDRYGINERLVIGVVTSSDNITLMPILIDGGLSKTGTKKLINGGESELNVLPILGGSSKIISREYVDVSSSGIEIVKVDSFNYDKIRMGDKLTISRKTPGSAEIRMISNTNPVGSRSIGKVIEKLNDGRVKVLLNIE